MMTEILPNGRTYVHRMTAHCETGVTSSLFLDKGLDLSEPMIFGIGSGIFFGHLPFVKWSAHHNFSIFAGCGFQKGCQKAGREDCPQAFSQLSKRHG
jgi:Butirosin biosynthesis protein H, N-terminal